MKKAMFFSVTVALVLFLASVFVNSNAKVSQEEDEFFVERVMINSVENHISDFRHQVAPSIFATATKPAIIALQSPGSKIYTNDLYNEVKMGANMGSSLATDENFAIAMAPTTTIKTYNIEYNIDRIVQTAFNRFDIVYEVKYEFTAFESTWKDTFEVIVPVSIYGLDDYNGNLIDDSWSPAPGCFVQEIFQSALGCPVGSDYSIIAP